MLVTLGDLRVKPGCLFQCKFFTAFFLNKVKMLHPRLLHVPARVTL